MPAIGRKLAFRMLTAVFLVSLIFAGCEQQPVGYIFEPEQRDKGNLARGIAAVVNSLYDNADEAVNFLDQAALTDDYSSLLLGGWMEVPMVDSLSGDPFVLYVRNYLDQQYYLMRFNRDPIPNAVRTPSGIDYTYAEIRSYQDSRTSEFFGANSEYVQLMLNYSDNGQDVENVDGWVEVITTIIVEEEIETAGAGNVTIERRIPVTAQIKLYDFSIDEEDLKSRIVILGSYPVWDELNDYHGIQIQGEINMKKDGTGSGEIWMWGERAVKIYFTGRSFGFEGYYTLAEEDHDTRYALD